MKGNRVSKILAVAAVLAVASLPAMAQSDVTAVVTGATTTFGAVATLCVAIGTFFVGYRIVKKAG